MATAPLIRFGWERLVTSESGPANPTTRHVLLTLATHVNREGQAWPSQKILAAETGLTERSICVHLKLAVDEGWLNRATHGNGKGWRNHIYTITLPSIATEPRSAASHPEGAEPRSAANHPEGAEPRSAAIRVNATNPQIASNGAEPHIDGAEPSALGAEADDTLVPKDVRINNVLSTSINNKGSNIESAASLFLDKVKSRTRNDGQRARELDAIGAQMQIPRMEGEPNGMYAVRIAQEKIQRLKAKVDQA